MPHQFASIFFIFVLAAACAQVDGENNTCGCSAWQQAAMFGPSRTRRSIPGHDIPPASSGMRNRNVIRIDDMLIPREEFERAASPGDGRLSAPSDYINCVRPWPNGVLRYIFSPLFPNSSRILVRESLAKLQSRTDNLVTFVELESFTEQHQVIVADYGGCWSYVGRVSTKYMKFQELSLAVPGCIVESIIQHEFIHALGFYHEQSRYDRDSYVDILWDNIYSTFQTCSNFRKNSYLIPSGFPSYDYESVMHYSSNTFNCSSNLSTIIKKDGGTIPDWNNITDLDIAKLKFVYSARNLEYCNTEMTTTTRITTRTTTTTTTTPMPRLSSGSMVLSSWVTVLSSAVASFFGIKFVLLLQNQ